MDNCKVKNCPFNYNDYNFTVIRNCGDNGYWYYGSSNDIVLSHKIAIEIGNGIVVKTEQIIA